MLLRGFDMVWIMGAEGLFVALFLATGLPVFEQLSAQMLHAQWHGMTAYDLIFSVIHFLVWCQHRYCCKSQLGTMSKVVQKQQYKHAIKTSFFLLFATWCYL